MRTFAVGGLTVAEVPAPGIHRSTSVIGRDGHSQRGIPFTRCHHKGRIGGIHFLQYFNTAIRGRSTTLIVLNSQCYRINADILERETGAFSVAGPHRVAVRIRECPGIGQILTAAGVRELYRQRSCTRYRTGDKRGFNPYFALFLFDGDTAGKDNIVFALNRTGQCDRISTGSGVGVGHDFASRTAAITERPGERVNIQQITRRVCEAEGVIFIGHYALNGTGRHDFFLVGHGDFGSRSRFVAIRILDRLSHGVGPCRTISDGVRSLTGRGLSITECPQP